MTNHRKNRRTRRSQRGGLFGFGESSDPNAQTQSWVDYFNIKRLEDKVKEGLNSANSAVGNAANSVIQGTQNLAGQAGNVLSQNVPLTGSTDSTMSNTGTDSSTNSAISNTGSFSQGGRRRRRPRSMKGGKGGLGLTYYASPVSGLNVAEPTSWQYYVNGTNQYYSVKGGSRKRKGRKSRRTRRHKKSLKYK